MRAARPSPTSRRFRCRIAGTDACCRPMASTNGSPSPRGPARATPRASSRCTSGWPTARCFGLAGLFERWRSEDGNVLDTCAIVTTEANALIAGMHDRMPLIIAPEQLRALARSGQCRCRRSDRALFLRRRWRITRCRPGSTTSAMTTPRCSSAAEPLAVETAAAAEPRIRRSRNRCSDHPLGPTACAPALVAVSCPDKSRSCTATPGAARDSALRRSATPKSSVTSSTKAGCGTLTPCAAKYAPAENTSRYSPAVKASASSSGASQRPSALVDTLLQQRIAGAASSGKAGPAFRRRACHAPCRARASSTVPLRFPAWPRRRGPHGARPPLRILCCRADSPSSYIDDGFVLACLRGLVRHLRQLALPRALDATVSHFAVQVRHARTHDALGTQSPLGPRVRDGAGPHIRAFAVGRGAREQEAAVREHRRAARGDGGGGTRGARRLADRVASGAPGARGKSRASRRAHRRLDAGAIAALASPNARRRSSRA